MFILHNLYVFLDFAKFPAIVPQVLIAGTLDSHDSYAVMEGMEAATG